MKKETSIENIREVSNNYAPYEWKEKDE
jgi:hypothetical protein